VSADQFREYPPIVSRTNANKILNREGLLGTRDNMAEDETPAYTVLAPGEPRLEDEKMSYQMLPETRACSEGEAGMW